MTAKTPDSGEAVRLQKYLSRAGVASRRAAERLIGEGRVSVDGTVVTELGTRVVPGQQVVRVDGSEVGLNPIRWIATYKPAGYLTTRRDDRGRPTVYSLLPDRCEDLFYVGRLDRLTEGLLIFTNEGDTAHRLLHPKYEIPRRYRVEVEGDVGAAEARRLERGVPLDDGLAAAEDVRVDSDAGRRGNSEIHLTLREGRKREVRRMMEALDLPVKRLVRVSFGPIEIGDLSPGAWRELTDGEIRSLRAAVGMGEDDGNT
ncbi:MAG: rRNA pseudouridine synthase [Gemmatimonadetes bacterium]|uniref:Pseudouridine synthase n=1 Tax=Candidatus Kutchimonas denitrificans TaxID=3056748 RepID=A0AAE5CBK6_9BACT|nr:rRNA pseudouridine synthase [Gemmatimonadota bacterium]NIR76007.1 rRNA pseudouridine synthase [Candidatus Kutchimonas denitrificans]NIS02199.1 rRNA pseudouridine synthase [Gemmatimonadota bacterium]NIT68025.1 rRNA pseudouridine synthase [Gemmatimonadota bacterium]NIU54051.1 pseudouridine synthase [Gemmatimonadota bacterium]